MDQTSTERDESTPAHEPERVDHVDDAATDDTTTDDLATDDATTVNNRATDVEPDRRPLRAALISPPAITAAALALVFTWRSFLPTLMPRTIVTQAAITALCAALGYAVGALVGAIGRRFLHDTDRAISDRTLRIARWVLAAGAALVFVIGLFGWARWQNQQRDLLGMDHIATLGFVLVTAIALVLFVILVLVGRLIGRGVAAIHRFNRRHVPALAVTPLTVVLVVVLALFLGRDVALQNVTSWINSVYGTVDDTTREGVTQPSSDLVSGSPGSAAAWDTLGMEGRNFVARSTPTALMTELHGDDAEVMDPVRVYAGIRSADTAEARAELVVEELRRTGGFDREYLAVWTVTGTGWVDPDGARAFELLHRGDTAIAAMQYSYLPSWIAMVLDDAPPLEAGAILFEAVYAAWRDLPADGRPTLVVFGQSLGSFGAEAAFAGLDVRTSVYNLVTRTDGALFTGPTNDNIIWSQLIEAREPYSPVWLPVIPEDLSVGRLGSVRFANSAAALEDPMTDWQGTRVLYVQHPSDPVTFWGMDWLTSPAAWMASPRGPDVPQRGGWFPVVTWVQGVFDLMAGFGAPAGHGHDYRDAFAGAWSQVTPVEGWTADDTRRMAQLLADTRPDW